MGRGRTNRVYAKIGDKFGDRVVIRIPHRETGDRPKVVVRCDANMSHKCVKEQTVRLSDLNKKKDPAIRCRQCANVNTAFKLTGVKREPPPPVHVRPEKPMKLPRNLCSASAAILRGAYSRGTI